MRTWGVATLVAALAVSGVLGVSGCGAERPHPLAADATPTIKPVYADTMEPSKAVMALVPPDATTLEVTNYDQIKILFGAERVTGRAPEGDQRALWSRADHESAQLTHGLLRGVDQELRRRFGWGAADVSWEASFGGGATGFVIRVADTVQPEKAIQAGVGPLRGAAYDAGRHLITKGTVAVGQESWGSDPVMVAVAGGPGTSTYVVKGCAHGAHVTTTTAMRQVSAYSVEFGGGIATVRIGTERDDLFDRMKLGAAVPAYAKAFTHGVGDPGSGRMGFRISDPVAAASLVTHEPMPYAACR